MSDNVFLRATVDLCLFVEEKPKLAALAKKLKKEAAGSWNNEQLGRELFEAIKEGYIEIDGVFNVEDHTE